MLPWFGFSLLSAFSNSLTFIIDKISVEKFLKNAGLATVLEGLFALLVALLIFTFAHIPLVFSFPILLSASAGILETFGTWLYYRSLEKEEASRVIALLQLIPVFVTILAFVLLTQTFSVLQYLGILFLVSGGFLISLKKLDFNFSFTSILSLMLLSTFLFGISTIILSYVLQSLTVLQVNFYFLIGYGVSSIAFFAFLDTRTAFWKSISSFGWRPLFGFFIGQTFFYLALTLEFLALSVGFAPLVSALRSTRVLFTFLFALILTLFLPRLLKEEIHGKVLIQKLLAIALMVVGAVLIS